jgi:hypothetical protein
MDFLEAAAGFFRPCAAASVAPPLHTDKKSAASARSDEQRVKKL